MTTGKRILILILCLFLPLGLWAAPRTLVLWTVEGAGAGGLSMIREAVESFTQKTGLKVIVENKDVESLYSYFIKSAAEQSGPDLIWTVGDHIGPFVKGNLILNLDKVVDPNRFYAPALSPTRTPGSPGIWAVPVTYGNHLMLFYHRDQVPMAPTTTDDLIAQGKALTKGRTFGLVFPAGDPFWLIPWLGGYGGQVFDRTGVQPTLNSIAMRKALNFIYDLKFTHKILAPDQDYNMANGAFTTKDPKTGLYLGAMIINGDWALADYKATIPDLGVARLPMVSQTGLWPAPYVNGKYLMIPRLLERDPPRLEQSIKLLEWLTSRDIQSQFQTKSLKISALKEGLTLTYASLDLQGRDMIKNSFDQTLNGIPMPTVPQMRFVWDELRPILKNLLNGNNSFKSLAEEAQQKVEQAMVN